MKEIIGIDRETLEREFTISEIEINKQMEASFKKHGVPFDALLPYTLANFLFAYERYINKCIDNKLMVRNKIKKACKIAFWVISVIAIVSGVYK